MKFAGQFECEKCGQEFTIELGPQSMKENKTPKKIGEFLGGIGRMMAESCLQHERDCTGRRLMPKKTRCAAAGCHNAVEPDDSLCREHRTLANHGAPA